MGQKISAIHSSFQLCEPKKIEKKKCVLLPDFSKNHFSKKKIFYSE